MENTRNAREKGTGIRLPYLLSLLIGLILLAAGGLVAVLLSVRVAGELTELPALILTLLLFAGTVLPFAGGVILALVLPSRTAETRKKIFLASSIVTPVLEALLALLLLILSFLPPVRGLVGEARAALMVVLLRAAALSLFLETVILTAAAALTGVFPKKKTLVFVLFAYAVVFLTFILLLSVLVALLNYGMLGIGIALGLLQPAAVCLPNVGMWKET